MKNIHILICTLCLLFTLPSFAQQQYDIRYSLQDMDCASNTVCYDVQLRSSDGSSWGLAGQNYRLYYDASLVSFSGATSSLTSQHYPSLATNPYSAINVVDSREQALPPGFDTGLGFNEELGFLNYAIDLNNLSTGGLDITGDWVTTSTVCFDIEDAALTSGDCLNMVWGRADRTSTFSTAYVTVSEWVAANNTEGAFGNVYNDLDSSTPSEACFATICNGGPVVTDPCAARGGDSDGDGICNLDDCAPLDASIPATPGTACSDGNPNTTNDVIAANGCSCVGTPVPVDPCAARGGDSDGDGICDADDCAPLNANIPTTPGTACSDGNPNTTNDVIAANGCSCVGTPIPVDPCADLGGDTDGDGICDARDCSPQNPNLPATPGTLCDDANPTTIDDAIGADGCSCAGIPIPNANPTTGTNSFDIQFQQKDYDCNAKQVCYDVQVKSTSGTWNLGSQNYRLFYNSANIAYASGSSNLSSNYADYTVAQDFQNRTAPSGHLSFNDDIGFLNYTIDLLNAQTGGTAITEADWVTTSSICFDLTSSALAQEDVCLDLVWARDLVTDSYASAFVEITEWIGTNEVAPTAVSSTANVSNTCIKVNCAPPPTETCTASYVLDGNSITISGLNGTNSLAYVLKDRTQAIFYCNSEFSQKCDPVVTLNNLEPGTYAIWLYEAGNPCIFDEIVIEGTISPCAAQGGDADGDGVCAVNDCNDNDPAVGAKLAAGTACNDGNPATSNDVILANGCDCQGTIDICFAQGGDADGDGICAANDCDDTNPAIGSRQPVGTACNDGNPATDNDVIGADGCSCAGTINVCFAKGGDADGDGVCAADDCDDNNPAIGVKQPVGTACNDSNPATDNDVIGADGCSCAGTVNPCYSKGGDTDGDGICDETDPCPGDPNNNCGPAPISCDDIAITGGTGAIEIANLTAPVEIVQVFDSNWKVVFKCQANCNTTEIVNNLPEGRYYVVVGLFDASWKYICSKKEYINVTGGGTATPVSNTKTETCGDITVTYGDGTITTTGQAGQDYYFKVARIRPSWEWVLNCTSSCGSTQTMEDLINGTYAIIVYDTNWKPVCRGIQITMEGSNVLSVPSTSRVIRRAEVTIEKEIQLEQAVSWTGSESTPVETTTLVNNTLDKGTYQVYPNPAQNELFVSLLDYAGQKASIRLMNQLGQIIQEIDFDELPTEAIQINVQDTDNGLHLLTIQIENGQAITEKIMINKY